MQLQHTLAKQVSFEGTGLHTGARARVTLVPAPENYGIRVVRTDLPGRPEIQADIDNVVDLARGTAIGNGTAKIHTLEHIMAAFAGMEIDNCVVEVDAQEIPQMDGSAQPWVELIREAGILEQSAQREYITIDEPVVHVDGDLALGVFPLEHFRLTCTIDFRHPALGVQYTTMFSLDEFEKNFAPARTFCFLSEIEKLREKELIKGGTLDSALVVQDVDLTQEHIEYIRRLFDEKTPLKQGKNGFLNNTEPRFYNEPCRHKALDLIGDLYLLGRPLNAHVLASRPGHAANHALAKLIRAQVNKKTRKKKTESEPVATYQDILDILPHRYPFLMIDKVEKIEGGKSITAYKNVSFNDPFFQGHFPDNPIMPGVLQVEAMAQAGGIMKLFGQKVGKDSTILFLGVDKVRWRGIVRPGDCLRIECVMLHDRGRTIRFDGKCYVGDKLVCEAELLAMLSREKSE